MPYAGHSFERHFILSPSASVLSAGDTSKLAPGQLGFFTKDGRTALNLSQLASYKGQVKIGIGSWNTKDVLYDGFGGRKLSDGTKAFKGQFITRLKLLKPVKAVQKRIAVGYDGITCDGPVNFDCNKNYTLRLDAWGSPIYRFLKHRFSKDYTVKTPCCDPCAEGCTAGTVDAKFVFEDWARQINSDKLVNKFLRARLKEENYSGMSGAVQFTIYELEVLDEGDAYALAAVQTAYKAAGLEVFRYKRSGIKSTYRVIKSGGAPSNYTPTAGISLATCGGVCPQGHSKTDAQDVYWVTRAVSSSDDLDSTADQTSFANTVKTAYSANSAKFISHTPAFAIVEIRVNKGTTVSPINSDAVNFVKTEDVICTPPANSSISWVSVGTVYKVPRKLCITLEKDCSGAGRLAELQAAYASVKDVVPESIKIAQKSGEGGDEDISTDCGDVYEIQQYNNAYLEDGCVEYDPPVWDELPAFEGIQWKECPCQEPASPSSNKVGLIIEAIYNPFDEQFSKYAFEFEDVLDLGMVDFDATLYDESGKTCDRDVIPVTVLNEATRAQMLGYNVLKEYVTNRAPYKCEPWFDKVRLREAFDVVSAEIIQREKYYKCYQLSHYIPNNTVSQHRFENENYTYFFWVPEDVNTTELEQYLIAFADQAGVELEVFG